MLFRHLITVTTTVLFYSVATGLCQQPPDRLDILIQNGKIVNGTGNPWFYADVGIVGDTIVAIGALDERAAARGIGTNAVLTIGFNELRSEVLEGNQLRSPTEKELETMKSAVRQAMREGAWGISTGIEYDGLNIYATTEEIIEVTKPVADFGGIYISHMRDEAAKIVDAVREIIRIGEETGVPVNVTHIKAAGTDNWGLMKEVVALINDVRARGIMITADQYPFLQGSPIDFITGLVDIPPDMDELAALDRSLRDDESRELPVDLRETRSRSERRRAVGMAGFPDQGRGQECSPPREDLGGAHRGPRPRRLRHRRRSHPRRARHSFCVGVAVARRHEACARSGLGHDRQRWGRIPDHRRLGRPRPGSSPVFR
jgi:N-acyl-D-aspartate/D-glutamate deacylase